MVLVILTSTILFNFYFIYFNFFFFLQNEVIDPKNSLKGQEPITSRRYKLALVRRVIFLDLICTLHIFPLFFAFLVW